MLGAEIVHLSFRGTKHPRLTMTLLHVICYPILMTLMIFSLNGIAMDHVGHAGGLICGRESHSKRLKVILYGISNLCLMLQQVLEMRSCRGESCEHQAGRWSRQSEVNGRLHFCRSCSRTVGVSLWVSGQLTRSVRRFFRDRGLKMRWGASVEWMKVLTDRVNSSLFEACRVSC